MSFRNAAPERCILMMTKQSFQILNVSIPCHLKHEWLITLYNVQYIIFWIKKWVNLKNMVIPFIINVFTYFFENLFMKVAAALLDGQELPHKTYLLSLQLSQAS